ncbi:MAG: putative Fimbrial assembly family protein [Candidatus Saccharibacteria bacterium]|nr:putative Fimbrial assembly family protein [Candidatus Saccharibacteria bacterium]
MIEFNLLPDIKMEYIKARKARQLVTTIAFFATLGSVVILLLTLSVKIYQVKRMHDLDNDITSNSRTLTHVPQLNRILTVQNQLGSLTALHDQKPAAALTFDYLNRLTPAQVKISSFTADFTGNTMSITGTADALSSVNKYVDTLKFTKYTDSTDKTAHSAFTNVVLASFGVSDTATDTSQKANYNITLSYDPVIFQNTSNAVLNVPSIISTRSEVAKPTDLFTAKPTTTPTAGGN